MHAETVTDFLEQSFLFGRDVDSDDFPSHVMTPDRGFWSLFSKRIFNVRNSNRECQPVSFAGVIEHGKGKN